MTEPKIVLSTKDLEQGPPPSGNRGQDQYSMYQALMNEYRDTIVGPRLQHQPCLEILDQFLDPHAQGFGLNQDHRMLHFDIKVIHVSKAGKVELPIKCTTPAKFRQAISEDNERGGSLVIAKDISGTMIEVLGMQYNIEPEFFAGYLQGTECFRMGYWESPAVRAPNLMPDYRRKAPFYMVDFRRPYNIDKGLQQIVKLRCTKTSTPRGVHILRSDLPDVFVFERIAVYKKKGSNVGIILTDSLLSNEPPAPYILTPVTSFNDHLGTLAPHGRRYQVSSRKELISWLHSLPSGEAAAIFADSELLALRPLLKLVELNSAMFLSHAQHIRSRIVVRNCGVQFPNSMEFFLQVTRSLHRQVHEHQRLLRCALHFASRKGGEATTDQICDFGYLIEDMDAALKALDEDVRFLASEASVMEGKIVGWVSKFAALFLPVSLLATILSISDPGYARWAILGGLSVPFVLISIYFMFFWRVPYLDSSRY